MLKHVGRQGQSRVVVVFREIPGEEHMALVAYPQQLPTAFHDDVMKCIESNAGQAAKHLGDALHRVVGRDGANLLVKMHREGWMKKVRTQDIIMTPSPGGQGARLDEINQIIRDMEAGGDAASRLAELDATSGIADPAKQQAGRAAAAAARTAPGGVLTDADIAQDLLKQADGMKAQINVLTEEINRLLAQAQDLDPSLAPKKRGRPKATA